ncbi:MAG: methylamine utilization protein [Armatimonadetes bacterium]|nr:methylamine utilization protein [Armatimonadota bacterium]
MMTSLLPLIVLGQASTVSGTLTLRGKPVGDAVVWLSGSVASKPMTAKIEQKGKAFIPHVLVVTSDSTVSFPNRDDIFHNVFAEYRAKKFDLGMYPKGQTREVTFDKTGVVSVLCNIHSNMSAYVIVVGTPFFAKTDRNGHFSIADVPKGTYKVEGWHESGATYQGSLNVAGPANLSFNLGR